MGRTVAQVMIEQNRKLFEAAKKPNPRIVMSPQVRLRTVDFIKRRRRIR